MEYNMTQQAEVAQFLNFEPTNEIKGLIKSLVNELEAIAPSDAAFRVVFEKNKKIFKGIVRVCSQAGTFIAEAVAEQPLHVLMEMDRHIRRQIEDWKCRRSLDGER